MTGSAAPLSTQEGRSSCEPQGLHVAGIGPRSYRTYPVRSGESIEDIISKRGIAREEVDLLNPDVNLSRLSGTASPLKIHHCSGYHDHAQDVSHRLSAPHQVSLGLLWLRWSLLGHSDILWLCQELMPYVKREACWSICSCSDLRVSLLSSART